jgi:hypothetical protein
MHFLSLYVFSNKEIFRYENQYKLHIVVHQEGKFVCSQCGKQLITKRYLIQVDIYHTLFTIPSQVDPPRGRRVESTLQAAHRVIATQRYFT